MDTVVPSCSRYQPDQVAAVLRDDAAACAVCNVDSRVARLGAWVSNRTKHKQARGREDKGMTAVWAQRLLATLAQQPHDSAPLVP